MRLTDSGAYQSASNLIGVIVLAAMSLLLTPLLLTVLGEHGFGIYRLAVISVVGFIMIIEVGFNAGLKNIVGRALNGGQTHRVAAIHAYALRTYACLAGIALATVGTTAFWLPQSLALSATLTRDYGFLAVGAAVYVGARLLETVYKTILVVKGRFDLVQCVSILAYGLRVGLVVLFLIMFPGSVWLAGVAVGLAGSLSALITWRFAHNYLPRVAERPMVTPDDVTKFYSMSWYGMLAALAPVILYYGQDFLIARVVGIEGVAYFGLVMVLITQFKTVISSLAAPVFTKVSKALADGESDLSKAMIGALEWLALLWLFIAVPAVVVAEDFFVLWVGREYAAVVPVFKVLLIGTLGIVLHLVSHHALVAIGRLEFVAHVSLATSLGALVLSYYLAVTLKEPLTGVAISISSALLLRGLMSALFAVRYLPDRVAACRRLFVVTFIPLVSACSIAYFSPAMSGPPSFLGVLFTATLLALAVAVVFYSLIVSPAHRVRSLARITEL